MDEKLGFKVVASFMFQNNVDSCVLFFNCKTWQYDCMFHTPKNVSAIDKTEHYVYCGIWNRYSKEKDVESYIVNVKYDHAMYRVSELNPRAKSFITNGVGPKHFGYFIPDLWWKHTADLHDLMYFVGGNYKDRKWADRIFLWGMLRTSKGLKKPFGTIMAYVYYCMVRLFGKNSFEYRSRKFSVHNINLMF